MTPEDIKILDEFSRKPHYTTAARRLARAICAALDEIELADRHADAQAHRRFLERGAKKAME